MDKNKILEKYKNEDDKLLISKFLDKIVMCEKQNKIQCTDFLTPVELKILEKIINSISFKNYKIYGGCNNAQRNIIILYPDKLADIMQNNGFDFNSVCNCIRIENNKEEYEHKIYLGGILKLGVKREKVGDIVVYGNCADIVVSKDITKFLLTNLKELVRFKNSQISVIDITEIKEIEQEFKDLKIIVSSLRLDNIVSELAKTSRNGASEILKQDRVFINYEVENKNTKLIKENDIITIRKIGKFIISSIEGNTRSGKVIINVKKFV